MPLEILKYRRFSEEALGQDTVNQGDYRTIINAKPKGEDEIIAIYCRKDDKLSYAYTIHPLALLTDKSKIAAFFRTDTGNRPLVIKPGEEVELFVRERTTRGRTALMRYKLSHKLPPR